MSLPYLLVSATIDETSPDAAEVRTLVRNRVSAGSGAWVNRNTAVVPMATTTALTEFVSDLQHLNEAFDPVFSCVAVFVPNGQFGFVTDKPADTPSVTAIMGRKPEGA